MRRRHPKLRRMFVGAFSAYVEAELRRSQQWRNPLSRIEAIESAKWAFERSCPRGWAAFGRYVIDGKDGAL